MPLLAYPARRWRWLLLTSVVLLCYPTLTHAQQGASAAYDVQKHLTISTTKLPEARAAATAFIRRRASQVLKQEETPEQLTAEFSLPKRALPALDSLAGRLGYVLENNLNTQSLADRLQGLRDDEADAALRLQRLEAEQRQLAAGRTADSTQRRLNRLHLDDATRALRRTRRELSAFTGHDSLVFVALRLFDEVTFPTANRSVLFVNMPGVEMGLLRLENPAPGLAARFYRGYSAKYLFTRGKSYFNLGIYKPTSKTAADTAARFVSELFLINFGQDFYPRHFGRGRRTFLNLYTTYQIGGVIVNRGAANDARFVPNANLGIGLELLKTKSLLFDTKASYFLPLNSLNRELRGLLMQGSFSFVF